MALWRDLVLRWFLRWRRRNIGPRPVDTREDIYTERPIEISDAIWLVDPNGARPFLESQMRCNPDTGSLEMLDSRFSFQEVVDKINASTDWQAYLIGDDLE